MRFSAVSLCLWMAGQLAAWCPAAASCIDYNDYPHEVGWLRTPSFAYGVAVSGDHAYVANGPAGFQVIDISDPEVPVIVGSLSSGSGETYDVAVSGHHAYLVGGGGLQVIDIADPQHPQLIGALDPGVGYSVFLRGSLAYLGTNSGLHIVDISNPGNPLLLGSAEMPYSYALGVFVDGNLAFVADCSAGLQVVDVADPHAPHIVGSMDTPGSANNLFISGEYAYLADWQGGFHVVDLADPIHPRITATIDTGYAAEDVVVSGACAFVADHDAGLQAIDVSIPDHPRIIGSVPMAAWALGLGGTYGYIVSGFDLHVIDISNPRRPQLLGHVATPTPAIGLAISGDIAWVTSQNSLYAIRIAASTSPDGPLILGRMEIATGPDLAVQGGYAYVPGYLGLQVVDITDPRRMQIVGSVDTWESATSITVSGNHAYVTASYEGLQIIDVSDPQNPWIVGALALPYHTTSVAVADRFAYVVGWGLPCTGRFAVIDITEPANPILVGELDMPGYLNAVEVADGYAFVAEWRECAWGQLEILDVSNPASPEFAGGAGTAPGEPWCLALSGSHLYLGTSAAGLQVFNISDPPNPQYVGGEGAAIGARDLAVSGRFACLAAGESGFLILPLQCDPAGVGQEARHIPFRLAEVFPNPASGCALFRLILPAASRVQATVSDITGRKVRRLEIPFAGAGAHDLLWDGRDDAGRAVAAGIYLARISAAGETRTSRVAILR